MTRAELLTVLEAIHDKCDLSDDATFVAQVNTVPFVFPNITRFTDKADYWQFVNALSTQYAIETTLMAAIWMDDISYTLDDPEKDSPLEDRKFSITLFTESDFTRYNPAADLDDFERKLNKTVFDHDLTREVLKRDFMGITPLGLDTAVFTVAETNSIQQFEETQREVNCPFIDDEKVIGSLTRFELPARIQLVAC